LQYGLCHPGELVVDSWLGTRRVGKCKVLQTPGSSQAVQLCKKDIFLLCFIGEPPLKLFLFSSVFFAAFVGRDAVSFEVLCPPGTDGARD
jgi:hypothetical protein